MPQSGVGCAVICSKLLRVYQQNYLHALAHSAGIRKRSSCHVHQAHHGVPEVGADQA